MKVSSMVGPLRSRHRRGRVIPLLLAGILAASICRSAELVVGAGEGLESIGEALAAARAGDVIVIREGLYRENLIVETPLTLRGEHGAEVRGKGKGDVLRILADAVTVEGLRISGSGDQMISSDAGVRIVGTRVQLRGNEIFDNLFGVYLDAASEAIVEGNRIIGRREREVGRRGAGIHLYDSHRNVVRGNVVSFVRDGVYFDHSDFNQVDDNEFSELRYGVHYMYCEDNTFRRNVFRDSVAGVAIMYTRRVTFVDNRILDNRRGYHAFGLLMNNCVDSIAEGNLIVNNASGIFLDGSHRNRFRRNLVAFNDVGLVLYASSLENRFSGNDFIGNLATLHTVGRAAADWAPDGLGNYYSDYSGYDLDGDGIGDVPHRLQDAFEYLEGNRPLLRLFLSSAAADALRTAEQSFPIIPRGEQTDPAPRMHPASGVEPQAGSVPAPGRVATVVAALGLILVTLATGWRLRR